MRHAIRFALAAALIGLMAACAAPPSSATAQSDAPATKPAPKTGGPLPALRGGGDRIDRSCSTNADCTVKDVRNCCGAMPACVNVNARIDPTKVQEDCKRGGMMSVCGFPAIEGCKCNRGRCIALPKPIDPIEDPAPAPPAKE